MKTFKIFYNMGNNIFSEYVVAKNLESAKNKLIKSINESTTEKYRTELNFHLLDKTY